MKEYQRELQLNTLYSTSKLGGVSGVGSQLKPNIEVVGSVNIYGAQEEPDTPPTDMTLFVENFSGFDSFSVIPSYIYITGEASRITVTGVKADVV